MTIFKAYKISKRIPYELSQFIMVIISMESSWFTLCTHATIDTDLTGSPPIEINWYLLFCCVIYV